MHTNRPKKSLSRFMVDRPLLSTWLVTQLGVESDDILDIFLVGSRLTGTSVNTSDYDFIVVLKHFQDPNTQQYFGYYEAEGFSVKVDCGVYGTTGLCWSNTQMPIISNGCWQNFTSCIYFSCSIYLVNSFGSVLLASTWSCGIFSYWKLVSVARTTILTQTGIKETSRAMTLARKFFDSGNLYQSKKKLIYSLRVLDFAQQVCTERVNS